jgi:predicted nucleic acid-binding protein
MGNILVDTSALYALTDSDDQFHQRAVSLLDSLRGETLIVPNFILAEAHTIINKRLGPQAAKDFLNASLQDYAIERVTPEDEMTAHAMLQEVSRSRNLSYFDVAAVALAERLGIERVFTFDRHFSQSGFKIIE